MPPAVLAWLDYSEADQRRAREIVAMFSQRESRDELGIGVIRDALSDALFPGTSVVLSRARYFLFIPWLFIAGARRGHSGPQLAAWVERQERQLIEALRSSGDLEGLIGRIAGGAVQNLPSTIYWNSLRRFGILRYGGTAAQVVGLPQISRALDDATELIERSDAVWAASIPEPPEHFFDLEESDFALTRDEATWLSERIVDSAPETLFAFLVASGHRPSADADYPWEDSAAAAAPGAIHRTIGEASRFAIVMHGAALLYNVLLAERAEELSLSQYEGFREHYTARLVEWRREIDTSDVAGWDLNGLWALVAEQGDSVTRRTRAFVEEWVALMRKRAGRGFAEDRAARVLVRQRELAQKGGQARLLNDRLMRQWGGASGSARLNFRWPVVTRLLDDIADGREHGSART